jgi:hypothetical protein
MCVGTGSRDRINHEDVGCEQSGHALVEESPVRLNLSSCLPNEFRIPPGLSLGAAEEITVHLFFLESRGVVSVAMLLSCREATWQGTGRTQRQLEGANASCLFEDAVTDGGIPAGTLRNLLPQTVC